MRPQRHTFIDLASILMSVIGITACASPPTQDDGIAVDVQGVLHFQSHDDFFRTIEAAGRMTATELDAWEQRHGFVSYRHEFESVMQRVANAPTPQVAAALVQANQDIVEQTSEGTGPRIRAFGYTVIANRRGLFFVEDVIHMVTPDVVISAEDGRVETLEATLASLDEQGVAPGLTAMTTPAPGVRVVPYHGPPQELQAASSGCTYRQSANYRTSDREVDVEFHTDIYTCSGCCGTYYTQDSVRGSLWGFKKNVWGNWVDYATSYNYEQVEFEIDAPRVVGITIGPNGELVSQFNYQPTTLSLSPGGSPGDWVHWDTQIWYVGDQVQNSPIEAPHFNKAKGRGKSRGTGAGGWAEFCCGYAGGCTFTPSCTPRTSCFVGECGLVSDNCGGFLNCGTCGGGGGGGCGIDPQFGECPAS